MSEAKTFRGILQGKVIVARRIEEDKKFDKHDLVSLYEELLNYFDEYYPKKIVKKQIEIIDGWKGEGGIDIYRGFTEDFEIVEHIKDKETEEVKQTHHTVLKEDLNRMIFIVKNLDINETYSCYYIAKKLGYDSWKDLWKERNEYFRFYYYPLKVLEALKVINYGGRGSITRLV